MMIAYYLLLKSFIFSPYQRKEQNAVSKKRKGRHDQASSDSDSDGGWPKGDGGASKQCFGPQCVKPSRPNSKYCSEECGLKLAEARIYSVITYVF